MATTALTPQRTKTRVGWQLWAGLVVLLHLLLLAAVVLGVGWGMRTLRDAATVNLGRLGSRGDALDAVAACCRFDLVRWEQQSLVRWLFTPALLGPLPPDATVEDAAVRRFFQLTQEIQRAEQQATGPPAGPTVEAYHRKVALQEEQTALRPRVERRLAQLVSHRLQVSEVASAVPGAALVLPPVAFQIVQPPAVLVVSPRDRIRLERSIVLEPDLPDERWLQMEQQAEGLRWSALVEPTGGYSTYPTIISATSPLGFALETISHEWSHTYLFLHPLGRNFFASEEMRTINETVANIVGREIGRPVAQQLIPPPTPPAAPPSPPPATPAPRFDFRAEMRATRLEAERLLQAGQIDDAEHYMEQRRQLFVQNGYYIRKLNQAYFAFHGTYADTPGSVSPIGPALEQLFQRAGSLRAFIQLVQDVDSYDAFRRLLSAQGIDFPADTANARR